MIIETLYQLAEAASQAGQPHTVQILVDALHVMEPPESHRLEGLEEVVASVLGSIATRIPQLEYVLMLPAIRWVCSECIGEEIASDVLGRG